MSQPILTIIAGCNGAGKSSLSPLLVPNGIIPFDYDLHKLAIYNSLYDSELRDRIAQNKTTELFESSINGAFSSNQDFCYETNFDTSPIYWAKIAKQKGYFLKLHFLCLRDLAQAKRRVQERVALQGHFIDNQTIEYKWQEGYKNLNIHFDFFDKVMIHDNSDLEQPVRRLLYIEKNNNDLFNITHFTSDLPEYVERRFPRIFELASI